MDQTITKAELEAKIEQWQAEATAATNTYISMMFEGAEDSLAAYFEWKRLDLQLTNAYAFYEQHFGEQAQEQPQEQQEQPF